MKINATPASRSGWEQIRGKDDWLRCRTDRSKRTLYVQESITCEFDYTARSYCKRSTVVIVVVLRTTISISESQVVGRLIKVPRYPIAFLRPPPFPVKLTGPVTLTCPF
jgi:hypothetical protein